MKSTAQDFRGGVASCRRFASHLLIIVFCTSLVIVFDGCKQESSTQAIVYTPPETFFSSALELGAPVDSDASDDLLIRHFQYTVSYNPNLNVANWVCWNEDSAWYGPVARCDCFGSDPQLPVYLAPVSDACYSGSGYDRGHIANSEARTRCDSDNHATFYYSNIIPQTASLNRQTWYSLEKYCDSLSVKANKELYVMAGGIYHSKKRLKNLVTVPDSCWKVVVVLDRSQRASAVTSATQVIAVMMNNGDYTKDNNDWRMYTTTVSTIEQVSGYHLLSALPVDVQAALKNKKFN